MTGIRRTILIAAVFAALAASGPSPTYGEDLPNVKAPWQFAPVIQEVSGRAPADVRPKGTMLGQASHVPSKYSAEELHERALAQYGGAGVGASRAIAPAQTAAAPRTSTTAVAAAPGWSLGARLALVGVVAAAVVGGSYGWARHMESRRLAEKARVRELSLARNRDLLRRLGG